MRAADGDFSYWTTDEFGVAARRSADVVVVMLGTCDAKAHNWEEGRFKAEMRALLLAIWPTRPGARLLLATPPPAYEPPAAYRIRADVVNDVVPTVLASLAREMGFELIDVHRAFSERGGSKDMIDGIHPTDQGHALIAAAVAELVSGERCIWASA